MEHKKGRLHKSNPIGTFIANTFGCIVSSVCNALIDYQRLTVLESNMLFALSHGFAGSLTTVSSFVSEINLMNTFMHGVRYSLISLCIAQLLVDSK